VHCIDPPVITIDNFLDGSVCDEMISQAQATNKMETSKIGGKSLAGSPDVESIRTSTTLALTSDILKAHPAMAQALDVILSSANKLLPLTPTSGGNSRFSKPSSPGSVVFELPQVAHYSNAQHFLSHEDAFPKDIALKKGYQRRGTLLLYLNDVPEGGKTTFDYLNVSVTPVKGRALLFFPSFKGCVSDGRTLHKAEDVTEAEKWISQIWISSALPAPPKKAGGKVQLPPGLKDARRGNPGR
jgi:prolyl 4-hydroxylase